MPDFVWRGIDPAGKPRNGRVSAATENDARTQLDRRKLYILAIEETAGQGNALLDPSRFGGRSRLNLTALSLFTRQLATLVQVSPIGEALTTIARQTERSGPKSVIDNVGRHVNEGQRLSDAMAQEPASFSPVYRAIVSAGDASGTLPDVLERLSAMVERRAEMRSKLTTALAYPVVLAVVAVAVVTALMLFVVPRMVEQFDTVGQQLPLLTRCVIAVSDFLSSFWWLIAGFLLMLGFGLWQALSHSATRQRIDTRMLKVPLIGKTIRDVSASSFARTLATMVSARVPLVQGLGLVRETIGNRAISLAVDRIGETVRAGGSLSSAMQASGVFPPMLVYLAASGESSGRLDLMLERAAEYLEREFDSKTATTLALLEPVIIVIMGIMVALIVLSVLLPILQLESLAAL